MRLDVWEQMDEMFPWCVDAWEETGEMFPWCVDARRIAYAMRLILVKNYLEVIGKPDTGLIFLSS